MQNVKTYLREKESFQPNLGAQRLKQTFGGKRIFLNLLEDKIYRG